MCEIEFQRMLINILSFILRSHKIIRYLRKEKKADGLCFQYERTTSDSDLLETLYITTCLVCMHKRKGEFSFRGCFGRANISRKILLHKTMLVIRSTINILSLVFTYFIICLRNKKYHYNFENSHISV